MKLLGFKLTDSEVNTFALEFKAKKRNRTFERIKLG
jgi:hypothetical protein